MSENLMDRKKALKLFLPLVISLVVIIVIALLATGLAKAKPEPSLSDPDGAFVTTDLYTVTNGTVYRNLKVSYGLYELQEMMDSNILKTYMDAVTAEQIQKAIDKAKYDNTSDKSMTDEEVAKQKASLSQSEREDIDEAFVQSQYLIGRRTQTDIENYYRLEEAKKAFALVKFREDIKATEDKNKADKKSYTDYFTEAQYNTYFEENYKPLVDALVVKFNSEFEAKETMKRYGVQADKYSTKWVKYDPAKPDDQTVDLTHEEIYQAFLNMYNDVNSYYVVGDVDPIPQTKVTITADGMTIDHSVETDNKYVQVTYDYTKLNDINSSLANKLFGEYGLKVYSTAETINADYYTKDFVKSYTINPTTDSSSKYYIAIKLSVGEPAQMNEEIKADIKEKLIIQNLTDTEINKQILKMRRDHSLVIYDNSLEKGYAAGDADFKTTSKTSANVVANYKLDNQTVNITADDLFSKLVTLYAPKDIGGIVDREILVRDMSLNDVYDIANDKVLNEDEYNRMKDTVESYRLAFANDAFAQYGFPASYGWTNFIRENFGATNLKELLVSLSLYQYVVKAYTEKSYTIDDVKAEMQKQVDAFFEANVMNLIIFVDYDNDNQPDKNIVGETNDSINWKQFQKNLADDLAKAVNNERAKVLVGTDQQTAFNTVIERYNNSTPNDPESWAIWGQYKEAGLRLKYEATGTTNNASNFVKEFLDETKALWNAEKDLGLLGHTTEPRWVPEAFETSYGFHFIGISSTTDYTYAHKDQNVILPSEEEINLFKRENESKEEGGTPLTEAEQTQINDKLTAEVRAALAKWYTPAVQKLEATNAANNGPVDLKLVDYRTSKHMTFANVNFPDLQTYYTEVLRINQELADKANEK